MANKLAHKGIKFKMLNFPLTATILIGTATCAAADNLTILRIKPNNLPTKTDCGTAPAKPKEYPIFPPVEYGHFYEGAFLVMAALKQAFPCKDVPKTALGTHCVHC
jgi:hypothetical protein